MAKKIRVLVFPCGSENAIEINNSLKYSVHVDVFGASSIEDHGRYAFKNYIDKVPYIGSNEFDSFFSALVKKLKIDVVFATHDTVMEYLSVRADRMKFHLVNGDPESTSIARRKSKTYSVFDQYSWAPRIFKNIDEVDEWPIVVKPDCGQGGQGVVIANDASQANFAINQIIEPVLVEYLPGDEVTVDCFTDNNGMLVCVSPRTRERVKAGISMRSRLLSLEEEINKIALDINLKLLLRGPWFFQLKKNKLNLWKLLEFSCRIAGSMVAQRAQGVNLPLMTIQNYMGREVIALPNKYIDLIERRIVTISKINFFYDTVFVDLDDTLIIDGCAVPLVLSFLYQAIGEKKIIKLITRHTLNIESTLKKAKIYPELFDEIIHITDNSSKANYITERSIFIDNHFPERYEVAIKKCVPVFDVDSLEFFIK